MSLVQDGVLELGMPARPLLGEDLPLVGEHVTVEHLLADRSGIGDYLDEDDGLDLNAHLMPVPVHELASTQDYVRVLDARPAKFAPGTGFSYCNAGYVILAPVIERATGTPFHDVVRRRVCEPAGMGDTAFLRSDELPGRAVVGYLSVDGAQRSNVFHLPVLGSGDGGIYSTASDVHRFWSALLGGRIIRSDLVEAMLPRRSDLPTAHGVGYGLGFWLGEGDRILTLEGYDAGVSYRSQHHRDTDRALTPRHWAGQRKEPRPSLPSASGLIPAVRPTASPPLDAPGIRDRSHGFTVAPHSSLSVCRRTRGSGSSCAPAVPPRPPAVARPPARHGSDTPLPVPRHLRSSASRRGRCSPCR